MIFFKNIFGKKDKKNEEDSFAESELKREKDMEYKKENNNFEISITKKVKIIESTGE